MCSFPAHIRTDDLGGTPTDVVQSVTAHCRATAHYAEECLSSVGLPTAGYTAGLLHDCGKFTQAFSDYIWAAHRGENVRRGSVNHTFAGVQYLLQHYHEGKNSPPEQLASELLAYAIGAHHGLFDLMKDRQVYGFPHRMQAQDIGCEEAVQNFLSLCADSSELEDLFQASTKEILSLFQRIRKLCTNDKTFSGPHTCFYLALLSRLILSAVIEGDRRDTAEFMYRMSYPTCLKDPSPLWSECLTYMEDKLGTFEHTTPIQMARAEISAQCAIKAAAPGGIYRLNVPTGGGKTLASLRYALTHAKVHHKQRIFFVIPLLSIIDQNSKVIRDFLPRQDIILEHHSNVIHTETADDSLDPRELLAENWSAPIIITTLVQMLNTCFSGKTTSIRRFQALCNSVIIFDEVQTVPTNMLSLFNLAVNFLSQFCGATILLCSATQPCLEQTTHPLYHQPEDIIPYNESLWKPFQRTHMQQAESCTLENIPDFLLGKLKDTRSLLVVCNKKDEANFLYHALSAKVPHLFHLSASMCMAHRRDTLEQLASTLKKKEITGGILCIATQVIEAGVDISFGCVVRLLAGMDSAVQAAGRCNRNGESPVIAPVYLLHCTDEKLSMLKEIQAAQNASASLLQEFALHPHQYHNDLTSDASIQYYYRTLYRNMPQGAQDFPIPNKEDTIFQMLSDNPRQTQFLEARAQPHFFLQQSFASAGQAFRVFDDDTVDVLIPYGREGMDLVASLCSERAAFDYAFVKDTLEKLKPYTISLFQYQFNKLSEQQAFYPTTGNQAIVLKSDYYDASTGLTLNPLAEQNTEVNLCDIPIL